MNDLSINVPYSSVLFADDTSAVISGDNLLYNLNNLYHLASAWFSANGLILNDSKTQALLYTPASSCVPLANSFLLGDSVEVNLSDPVKCLGITLDNHLNWKTHVTTVIAKLHSQTWVLRNLARIATRSCCLAFYHANIVSHLRYGVALWGGCPSANDIFIQQKKMLRVMYGRPVNSPCRQLFIKEGLLTFPSIYMFECLKFAVFNKLIIPEDLLPEHCYDSRHKNIKNLKIRLSVTERQVKYASIKIFNALPDTFKTVFKSGEINVFLRLLHKFLLEKGFYSLEELYAD